MTHFLVRRRVLAGLGAALLLPGCNPSASNDHAPLVEALRGGGLVIYFRHAATDRGGNDNLGMTRDEQRNLSPEGIEQSRRIGRRFRTLGIPVGTVLSSPFYRCTDMADLAFGRHTPEPRLISVANTGGPDERTAWLARRLSTAPADGRNLVLISHSGNIRAAAGVTLAEGEAAVFRPLGDSFSVLGQVRAEDW